MALYSFAYDELVICPQCGGHDFTMMKSVARLRCNSCKTSYSEHSLVEDAATTMCDYIRTHGIHERPAPELFTNTNPANPEVNPLSALAAALQVLSYPEAVTPETLDRTRRMVRAALSTGHFR